MRIGLFSDTYPPNINGVANSTYILRNELVRQGHEVYVVTTYAGMGPAKWNEDHTILQLAGPELKFLYGYVATSPFHYIGFEEVKKLNLDIIHAQTEFGVGLFARICAKNLKIPLVSTYHTTYEDYTHYVNFINSRAVDAIAKKGIAKVSRLYGDFSMEVIAPSEKTKEMLLGYHIRREINVIPTGLEFAQFDPTKEDKEKTKQIRAEYGFHLEDRMVVYVGRLAEEKALDLVIRGFAQALKQGTQIRLLIVGGGPDLESLEKLTKDLGIADSVKLSGPKPATEIADYYRSADAFISASLTETQGMTFIEALASGLPLFARKDDVLNNLLIPEKTGWFFSDENSLAELLQQFTEIPSSRLEEMKKDCLKVVEPFSAKTFGTRVLEVYRNTIEEYHHQYEIIDVQVKDSTVQVYLMSNEKEELRLQVSLDDYYNMGMRRGGVITSKALEDLKEREKAAVAYQRCLRKLAVKDRSRKEIYDWLTMNTECDIATINTIVSKLEDKGYINDERLCASQIAIMRTGLSGRERIIRVLKKRGLPYEMIVEKLDQRPDDEQIAALRYAEKLQNTHKSDSVKKTKSYIRSRMIQQGYAPGLSDQIIDNLDFSANESREEDNLHKCALKAKRKYSRNFSGSELRNRIFRYCAMQGYDYEDIYAALDEMEWNDDEN